jgi:hypothetical protein
MWLHETLSVVSAGETGNAIRNDQAAPVAPMAKPLPVDFIGARHVVVVKREPTGSPNIERCEFEEK